MGWTLGFNAIRRYQFNLHYQLARTGDQPHTAGLQ